MSEAAPRLRRPWIARLSPRGDVGIDEAAGPRAIVGAAAAVVGVDPVRWAIQVSAGVVDQIVREVPALGGHPAAVTALRRSNDVTTLRALFALAADPAAAPPASEAIHEGVREFVHRAVPLEQVLHGVRVGHAATAEAFLRACAEQVDQEAAVDEITEVSRELFAYVDDLADAMIRTYLTEHEAWTTSAAAARADVVRSVLADGTSVSVDEASRVLGYDLGRIHEAVVVWSDSPGGGGALQAIASAVLRGLGATRTLLVPVASGRLWAWGAVASGEPRRAGSSESLAVELSRQRTHVAVGTTGSGVAGFRRSHREAERGERLERLRLQAGRPPRPVTAYADIAPVAMLATDLEAARDFVRRELGALCARDATTASLRTTLFHYIDAERSLTDVAHRLHVARGTVTYRVRRAQEVLGRGVDEQRLALYTALALTEEMGDAVLPPRDARH